MSNKPSVIEIVARLQADTSDLYRELQKGGKGFDQFERRGKGAVSGIERAFTGLSRKVDGVMMGINKRIARGAVTWGKRIGIGLGAAFVGGTAFSIKRAMDKEELENYFKVVMGGMQAEATKWAEDLGKRWKLNPTRFKETLATFKQMTEGMGLTEAQAYDMAKALTKLNVDMASFRNVGLDEMFQKIQSGLSGEIEPLKRFGIILSEAQVQAYAYANGIAQVGANTDLARRKQELASKEYQLGVQKVRESSKTDMEKAVALEKLAIRFQQTTEKIQGQKQKLSEAEKVLARFGLLMQLTGKDQNDYQNTMNSTSNRLKQMRDQLEILQEKWGGIFLVGVNLAADAIMPSFEQMVKWIDKNKVELEQFVNDGVRKLIVALGKVRAWFLENKDNILKFLKTAGRSIKWIVETAAKYPKTALGAWLALSLGPKLGMMAMGGKALFGGGAAGAGGLFKSLTGALLKLRGAAMLLGRAVLPFLGPAGLISGTALTFYALGTAINNLIDNKFPKLSQAIDDFFQNITDKMNKPEA